MKKISYLLSCFLLCSNLMIAQVNSKQCVSCNNNNVDFEKYASAIGQNNVSTGYTSFTSGKYNEASGDYSTALGNKVRATARSSFAAGYLSEATGVFSAAFGYGAKAGQHSSMAMGFMVEAISPASFVTGRYVKATASNAMIIGSGYGTNKLINNEPSTLMIGFNSTKPTLFISRSPGYDKTGRIAIGNIPDFCSANQDVRAKFHIKSDIDEDAIMFIEPSSWKDRSWAEIKIGDKKHSVKATHDYGLEFNTAKNFIFNDGKVGIGIKKPKQELDVNGNIILSGQQASLLFADDNSKGEWGEWGIEYQYGGLNFWKPWGSNNFGNNFLFLSDSGNVGIGTKTPLAKLQINGTLLTKGIKMPQQDIKDGYVLTTDIEGNSSWKPTQNLWEKSEDGNIFKLEGNVGIGNKNPLAKLHIKSGINEAAVMFIEPNEWKENACAEIKIGDNEHTVKATYNNGLEFNTAKNFIFNNGNVGIGTVSPIEKFEVDGNVKVSGKMNISNIIASNSLIIPNVNVTNKIISANGEFTEQMTVNGTLKINGWISGSSNVGGIFIDTDNNVGIGIVPENNTPHKLYVAGGITTEEVVIKTKDKWPDFVFDENYKLYTLEEVEHFIKINKRLPDIPSAKKIKENGLEVAKTNALLMQKIEELTLYLIKQQKEINNLKNKIDELRN